MKNIYSFVLDCEGDKSAELVAARSLKQAVKRFIDEYESGVDKEERTDLDETMETKISSGKDFFLFTYNGDMELSVHKIGHPQIFSNK